MKADANDYIAEKMAKPASFGKAGRPDGANIFDAMLDATTAAGAFMRV